MTSAESHDIFLTCEGCNWNSLQLSPPLVTDDLNVLLNTLASMRLHTPSLIPTTPPTPSDLTTAFTKLRDSVRQAALNTQGPTAKLLFSPTEPTLPELPLAPLPHTVAAPQRFPALTLHPTSQPSIAYTTITSLPSQSSGKSSIVAQNLAAPIPLTLAFTPTATNPYPNVLYTPTAPPLPLQPLPHPATLAPLIAHLCPLTRTLLLKPSHSPALPPTVTRAAQLLIPSITYRALSLPVESLETSVVGGAPDRVFHTLTLTSPLPYPIRVTIAPISMEEAWKSPQLPPIDAGGVSAIAKLNGEAIRDHIARMSVTDVQKEQMIKTTDSSPCPQWKRTFIVWNMSEAAQDLDMMHVSIQLSPHVTDDQLDPSMIVHTIGVDSALREEFSRFVSLCNQIPIDHVNVQSALVDQGLINSFSVVKSGVVSINDSSTTVLLGELPGCRTPLRVTCESLTENAGLQFDVLLSRK